MHVIAYEVFGSHLTGTKNICGMDMEQLSTLMKNEHLHDVEHDMVRNIHYNRYDISGGNRVTVALKLSHTGKFSGMRCVSRKDDPYVDPNPVWEEEFPREYFYGPGFDVDHFIATYTSWHLHKYPAPSSPLDLEMSDLLINDVGIVDFKAEHVAALMASPRDIPRAFPRTYEAMRRQKRACGWRAHRVHVEYMHLHVIQIATAYSPIPCALTGEEELLGWTDHAVLAHLLYDEVIAGRPLPTNFYRFMLSKSRIAAEIREMYLTYERHHFHSDLTMANMSRDILVDMYTSGKFDHLRNHSDDDE